MSCPTLHSCTCNNASPSPRGQRSPRPMQSKPSRAWQRKRPTSSKENINKPKRHYHLPSGFPLPPPIETSMNVIQQKKQESLSLPCHAEMRATLPPHYPTPLSPFFYQLSPQERARGRREGSRRWFVLWRGRGSHEHALAALGRLVGVLRLLHLADEQLKGPGDVLVVPGAGLGPGSLVLLGHGLALLGRHLALLGAQVALVADDADGDAGRAL